LLNFLENGIDFILLCAKRQILLPVSGENHAIFVKIVIDGNGLNLVC